MVNSQTLRRELEPISPTALGSFVKLERCDQYLGWKYLADDLIGDGERFEESILSPLYAESGTRFEADQLRALLNQLRVDTVITPEDDILMQLLPTRPGKMMHQMTRMEVRILGNLV